MFNKQQSQKYRYTDDREFRIMKRTYNNGQIKYMPQMQSFGDWRSMSMSEYNTIEDARQHIDDYKVHNPVLIESEVIYEE